MRKKLTVTIAEEVYEGLYRRVGKRRISAFIERLVRPYVLDEDLERSYHEIAREEEREHEAGEWAEGLIGDVENAER